MCAEVLLKAVYWTTLCAQSSWSTLRKAGKFDFGKADPETYPEPHSEAAHK